MYSNKKKSYIEYDSCIKRTNRRELSLSSESLYEIINNLEEHINDIEKKINRLKNKEKNFNYIHLIKSLLCDNQIQFGGSMAYGTFISQSSQTVLPDKPFLFEHKTAMKNFHFEHNTHHIKVLLSGVYTVHLIIQVVQPSQICLFVNNNPLLKTVTSTNTNSYVISLSYTIALNKHDKIEIRNFDKTNTIITSMNAIGTTEPSQNFNLMFNRISVLCNNEYEYINKNCISDNETFSSDSESSNICSCSSSCSCADSVDSEDSEGSVDSEDSVDSQKSHNSRESQKSNNSKK